MSDKLVRICNRYDTYDNLKDTVLRKGELAACSTTSINAPNVFIGNGQYKLSQLVSINNSYLGFIKYQAGKTYSIISNFNVHGSVPYLDFNKKSLLFTIMIDGFIPQYIYWKNDIDDDDTSEESHYIEVPIISSTDSNQDYDTCNKLKIKLSNFSNGMSLRVLVDLPNLNDNTISTIDEEGSNITINRNINIFVSNLDSANVY